MYLILVGAFSKWLRIEIIQTFATEIAVFANHGISCKIVTDNGSIFHNEHLQTLMNIFSIPYLLQ